MRQRCNDAIPMQTQPLHKCGAFFLEALNADHLGKFHSDSLNAPFDGGARETKALCYGLVGFAIDDGTQHSNGLLSAFVMRVDV